MSETTYDRRAGRAVLDPSRPVVTESSVRTDASRDLLRRIDRWREEGEVAIVTMAAHLALIRASPAAHAGSSAGPW